MRTLQQIEPRTPIGSVPFVISQPGSYYFTGPLHHGGTGVAIEIAASDVALDGGGFTLTGNPSSGDLIAVSGTKTNVRIRATNLGSSGQDGIGARGVRHLTLEDVHVRGCAGAGVRMSSGVIRGLVAEDNGGPGVFMGNPVPGIGIVVKKHPNNLHAHRNAGGGVAIEGDFDVELAGVLHGNTGHGISWTPANPDDGLRLKLENCDVARNTGNGLHLAGASSAEVRCEMAGVSFSHNGGAGVFSTKPVPGVGIVVKKNPGSGADIRHNGAGGLVLEGDCDVEFSGLVSDNTGHGISWSSLTPGEKLRLHLDGAVIRENVGHGVRVSSADPVHIDFSSTQSRIIGNQGPGVDLDGYSGQIDVTVVGSKISQNAGTGIRVVTGVDNPTTGLFRANEITGNGGEGIHLAGARAQMDDVHVSGNASHGVLVEARREFKGHVTLLKRGSSSHRNGGDGVRVVSAENDAGCGVVLENSQFDGNDGSGVYVETAHGGSIASVAGANVQFNDNGLHGLAVTGTVGSGTGSVNLRTCTCAGNAKSGAAIDHPGVSGGQITGVFASGNGESGLLLGGQSLLVTGNTSTDNAEAGIWIKGGAHYVAENRCINNPTGIALTGDHSALAQNVIAGSTIPIADYSGTNPAAPLQDVAVGTNPLGNVVY